MAFLVNYLSHAPYVPYLRVLFRYLTYASYLCTLLVLFARLNFFRMGLFSLVYQKLTIFRGLLKAQQVVLFLCRSENTHKSSRGGENFEAYLKREINLMFLCCIFSFAQP